ncbi:hypothetical protein K7432_000592 [Basidiobolus ranarum]|uniref:Uncharacterized protein n=1 Tax=Basidiobolus ranarum TaxID=34480 RepID=A0ABR2X4E4_9FUNG
MYLQIALINTLIFASLTNASDAQLNTPIANVALATATTFPASENMMFGTDTDFFIPDPILDEEVELTPEESQLHRVNLGKILTRLSESTPGKIKKLDSTKLHKPGKHVTTMHSEYGEQNANTPVTSDSVAVPNVAFSADDEENADLDSSPEETELRHGGRGGRGGRGRRGGRRDRGRGRFGRGRGRFGRGRFGRGGRFGRFGGRRFGRFGRFGSWGSGWNDDCGGDDCGDC